VQKSIGTAETGKTWLMAKGIFGSAANVSREYAEGDA